MLVKIKLNGSTMGMRNRTTNVSAYTLLHLLSDLRGRAFGSIVMMAAMHLTAIINPAIFESFRDSPLDIRCAELLLDGMPNESMKRHLKTMVKPERLSLWGINVAVMDGADSQALFDFIATGKKWCASLSLSGINASGRDIDNLVKVCFHAHVIIQ